MTDQTPILQLPYILPSQAQKHVTHNEAIRLLDVIVQLTVTARNLPVPPASPAMGDRYIVATGASGDWAGRTGEIALFENGAWQFFSPKTGWTAWVTSEQVLANFNGAVWVSQADGPFNVGQLGVSATPDAVNRLSVSSDATLLNHAGAGHQLKLNKAAATDTTSVLFQTGFSGRAEMGTAGSDDFAIKVSANGTSFVTGLSIASDTGAVTLPVAAILGGQPSDPIAPPNGTIWLNSTTGQIKMQSAGASVVIGQGAISNAELAAMPSPSFKARRTAGTGAPEDISPADAAALLPLFNAASKGLVPASGGGTATFLRADGTWAAPAGGGGSTPTDGINSAPLINGHFEFWQRGAAQTSAGYGSADRHASFFIGGSVTMSRQDFALGSVFAGNNLRHFLRQTVSGQTLASHYAAFGQRIEDVRTLAGQTVTVLFWAKASAARPIALEIEQNFGTGGSPSAAISIAPVTVNLTTDWQAYAATFNVPSVSGKVLGTAGNDYLALNFWTSAGADYDYNAMSSNLGLQSGDVDITGIHIRRGLVSAAAVDSYRVPDRATELLRCQRYFQTVDGGGVSYLSSASAPQLFWLSYTEMRAVPSVSLLGYLQGSGATIGAPIYIGTNGAHILLNAVHAGLYASGRFLISAEL